MKGIILNFLQKAPAYIASMVDYTNLLCRIIKNSFYSDPMLYQIRVVIIIIIIEFFAINSIGIVLSCCLKTIILLGKKKTILILYR